MSLGTSGMGFCCCGSESVEVLLGVDDVTEEVEGAFTLREDKGVTFFVVVVVVEVEVEVLVEAVDL